MKSMVIETIAGILDEVRSAGQMALQAQQAGILERGYKPDGSVVTQIDIQVEERLHACISAAFPRANILTEETARSCDPGKVYTFTVDPIDGTDAFSLGMPSWCVCVGLMKEFQPVAGVIYSPRMDIFLFADVGQAAMLNGQPLRRQQEQAEISAQTNIIVSSSLHLQVELKRFPGKIRNTGSAALQLVHPAIYSGIFATVEGGGTHIWDILAAHAICISQGLVCEYLDGKKLVYQELTDGRTVGAPLLAGHPDNIEQLRTILSAGR